MNDEFRSNDFSPEAVLYRHAALEVSSDHDRVFASLGMTDAPQRTIASGDSGPHSTTLVWGTIMVDYSMTYSQVLQQVTRFILNRDRSLGLLAMCRDRDKLGFRKGIPS